MANPIGDQNVGIKHVSRPRGWEIEYTYEGTTLAAFPTVCYNS